MTETEIFEIADRTPEQLEAIEARKVFLANERAEEFADRARRAKARAIDPIATAQMLLKKRLVTQAWINRKDPDQLRRFVKIACIAHQQDAISMSGQVIPFASIVTSRSWNK